MKLYLFRHASVEKAYRGCYNGHIDINASNEGLKEAQKNFKELASINFDAIYCSTLKRAKQTLEVFNLKQDVYFRDVLREKSWGRHEGKSYDEVVALEGEQYKDFRQWLEVLDGQNYEDFIEDIKGFLRELQVTNMKDILLICHGGVIYTMIHILELISLEKAFAKEVKYGQFYLLEFI